jgi:hypothetical protein
LFSPIKTVQKKSIERKSIILEPKSSFNFRAVANSSTLNNQILNSVINPYVQPITNKKKSQRSISNLEVYRPKTVSSKIVKFKSTVTSDQNSLASKSKQKIKFKLGDKNSDIPIEIHEPIEPSLNS